MTQPDIDDTTDREPTDAEVAAVAAEEARETSRAAKNPTPKRGPGRPPGAKNKAPATREAQARGATSRPTSTAPRTALAAVPTGTDAASRAERKRIRDERATHVADLTGEMLKHRVSVVRAVGMATGLPAQYLVGIEADESGAPIVGPDGRPRESLTHYGQALAPQDWQVKTCVEAYVRLEESEQGQRMLATMDRLMPYAMMVGALGALGMYTMTVLQASAAIKPMVQIEMQQAAAAAAAAANNVPPQAPGASGGAPG